MNRGSFDSPGEAQARGLTSMRPRFMNRGSGSKLAGQLVQLLTSMRPRFMNRGSDVAVVDGVAVAGHFNEAPIHESGKYLSRTDIEHIYARLQ